jgi:hypothetical protein
MVEVQDSTVMTGPSGDEPGPRARTILDYVQTLEHLVPAAKTSADWAPLARFVAVDEFDRVGAFLEVQDWHQYTEMLNQWAGSVDSFETTVRRVAELADLVYFEVEERHLRSGEVHVVNSMTVFEFGDDGKIRHLRVYLQQAR